MIPKTNCPHCDKVLWDDNPPDQPKKGDFCICVYCGQVSVFSKNLKLLIPKKIPGHIEAKAGLIQIAMSINISMEQILKDALIKDGHIYEH